MKNIIRIYKIMLRYSGYLIAGLFFMLGFALFSGVSVTLAIPLFDYVFMDDKPEILYTQFDKFLEVIVHTFSEYLHNNDIKTMFSATALDNLGEKVGSILSVSDPILLLWIISISVIILIILKNFFFYGNRVMFANLRGRTVKTIREKMFRKYLHQSLEFFSTNKIGDSLVRMVSDVRIVSHLFIGSLFQTLQNVVLLIVYTTIALFLNPRLFLVSLILFPVFSFFLGALGKKIKKYAKRIQAHSSDLFSNVEESLNNMPVVKAFARENHEFSKFNIINTRFFRFWRKSILYTAINVPLSEFNGTFMGIIVLLVGGKQVLAPGSSFTYGQFITFLLAIFSMLHPMKKLTKAYADIRKALVSLNRISVILDRRSEILDKKNSQSKRTFNDSIKFQNVSFSYIENKQILTDISFTVEKGQQAAIVGVSGSGKSTLVNLLPRFYDHQEGKILIDGIPTEDIKLKDLRTLFGFVTQDSYLFNDSIYNNIKYGTLKDISEDDIHKAAEIAFADEFINNIPEKFNHILAIHGNDLSGGQKQRLCIARAIVGDPPILIFDEATSALDTEAEQKVQKAIERVTKNRTVIVIAHRLSTVLSSDKIVVLEKGRIVGLGTHAELLKTCDRYKKLYQLQFRDNSSE